MAAVFIWMTALLPAGDGRLPMQPARPAHATTAHVHRPSPYYGGGPDSDDGPHVGEDVSVLPTQYLTPAASPPVESPTIPTRQPTFVDDPPTWKPGWLKGGRATTFYVPGSGDDLGFAGLDLRTTLVAPLPLLSFTPQVNLLWADGPPSFTGDPADRPDGPSDVPGLLTGASVEARWFQPLSDPWMLDLAVAPGIYTDGTNTSGDAVRTTGRALAFYKWHEAVRLAVGAVYLDREDISVLPAVGLMLFPSTETRIELMFPRPRLAHRIFNRAGVERWLYAAGEFGGGQWAVRRADGSDDTLQIREFRFLTGLEQKTPGGAGWLVEGGYVFGRELEYHSGRGDTELDFAAIVRAGVTF